MIILTEKSDFEKLYKIDREKILRYYDRLKNQLKNSSPVQIVARFLINQSIGSGYQEVYDTLLYFRDKIEEDKELLDLAFEWIRAQKIRLEYKKYLIRAQYPLNNLSLAVDDCIFRFFLEYDKHIRKLLKKDISEYNFSTLYEIFFSPYESKNLHVRDILERHIDKVPTHYQGVEKIDTNIIILRSGFSVIIVKDYENVLFSRREEKVRKELKYTKKTKPSQQVENKFEGYLIDRIIKTHCIRKIQITEKDIENATSQFLSSYFKFGKIYNFDDFKELLIRNLVDDIISAFPSNFKTFNTENKIKRSLSNVLNRFSRISKMRKLDGLAWKNDLQPILKNYMANIVKSISY
ncbi:hypothetical protein LCGC14_1304230 [marine sediment metagenome]|uniref:Uncharacterized protein n=1 Tax=marine sediment metagenome TaxID=412755 RepID=A0A0F9KPX8_9ZZZZ